MKQLALAILFALTLSACGVSDRYKVEDGVCTRHYRAWTIWETDSEVTTVNAKHCLEAQVP